MLRLGICSDCLGPDGALAITDLARAISEGPLNAQVTVERQSCGETCPSPARLWLQSKGGAAYVFEGIDLAADRNDILATLHAYLAHPGGWIEDARPCGRLRFCLTARVPG